MRHQIGATVALDIDWRSPGCADWLVMATSSARGGRQISVELWRETWKGWNELGGRSSSLVLSFFETTAHFSASSDPAAVCVHTTTC